MISIKNLTISYKKNENVIDGLNLQMQDNCIHGIVGLNGSGKTTLLNSIFGLKSHDEGDILYNNEKPSKKSIAYLPTVNYFYPNITGREYLNLFKNKEFDIERWNSLFLLPLDKIIDILLKLREKGYTIIVTSHIIETLTNMCDYIHYLEGGKIKYSKEKDGFKDFENEIFNSLENKNKGLIDDLMGSV